MGVDPISIALIAASVYSAGTTLKNAKSQAKAVTATAETNAQNKAIQTAAKAAYQRTSFLSSGFTLEGTPTSVLNSTYYTGRQDINQIISNANIQSKNIMSQARSSAIESLMSTAAMSGISSGFGNYTSMGVGRAQDLGLISGNTAYSMLDTMDSWSV